MPTIEDTIILATTAHKGQTDKAGLPYILHPLRVMSMFVLPNEDDERMVAVLHDVVEDTHLTLETLRRSYHSRLVDAIDAISRRRDETYQEYIERVAKNPLAARVKLADLEDNIDQRRASTKKLPVEATARYLRAHQRLRWLKANSGSFSGVPVDQSTPGD